MEKEKFHKRIDAIQTKYKQWLDLQEKLKESHQDWLKCTELTSELNKFYFEGEFQEIHGEIEKNNLELDLKTSGEYSIMSEDAIWNSLYDYQQLMWTQFRFLVSVLDPSSNDKNNKK